MQLKEKIAEASVSLVRRIQNLKDNLGREAWVKIGCGSFNKTFVRARFTCPRREGPLQIMFRGSSTLGIFNLTLKTFQRFY
ncbi:hypothetical protein EVAR_49938_1 [Eumeta japonica]|uniref:Uncharacterized protein n=1 Tax=Eumeta variegata TaxID=151549 RepID=A0A4C1XV74_EUMVA|nr:hypothetical protein EVAR_49938_1 [Eumeta japonica]